MKLKSIIALFSVLLFNILSGSLIASASGLPVMPVIGTGMALSVFLPKVSGVLPIAIFITSDYAKLLDDRFQFHF